MCCQAVRAAPMMYEVADMRSRLIWIIQACIVVPVFLSFPWGAAIWGLDSLFPDEDIGGFQQHRQIC
jgi:hypothetical protein